MKRQSGFTLVELAIVLMIIGLLIGGVLRGQELMNNARISSTIQQVKAYEGATITFRDTYAVLPGDLFNAINRLPGCTGANNCGNGNGDGLIGVADTVWGSSGTTINTENAQFWKHLALAHLISGVDPSAGTLSFGKSNPTSPLGGGFTIIQSMVIGDVAAFSGIVMRIHNGVADGNIETNPIVSPHEAAQIDRKMDDGLPFSGDVRSSSEPGHDPTNACENAYNETVTTKSCITDFMVQR